MDANTGTCIPNKLANRFYQYLDLLRAGVLYQLSPQRSFPRFYIVVFSPAEKSYYIVDFSHSHVKKMFMKSKLRLISVFYTFSDCIYFLHMYTLRFVFPIYKFIWKVFKSDTWKLAYVIFWEMYVMQSNEKMNM